LHKLGVYVAGTVALNPSNSSVTLVRSGSRITLKEEHDGHPLSRYIAGQIPYYYREPKAIGADFAARHDALEMILALFSQSPTTAKFQNSHCGEILSSIFLEDVVGYRRLLCKLTLTTAEDTNVHKMDGFFVKTTCDPFQYLFVEAKTSILPTDKTKFSGHRHGILKQMITSLGAYDKVDERFDFTRIRDNLEQGFSPSEAKQIRSDLVPPGPSNASYVGVAVTNKQTIDQGDDDYILSAASNKKFDFYGLVVVDLKQLAQESYQHGKIISDVTNSGTA
jgi:hypothetical protein